MKSRSVLLCLLLAATSVNAEVLNMATSESSAATSQAETPRRGTTQAGVTARYGEPKQRIAAVGQPPISRWVYDAFTVYFEGDRVIHAVTNK